jgi:hypothetical protein
MEAMVVRVLHALFPTERVLALTQFVITSTNVHAISKDQGISFGHVEQAAPRAGIQGWRTAIRASGTTISTRFWTIHRTIAKALSTRFCT